MLAKQTPPPPSNCWAMDKPGNASLGPTDFSEPWKLSDVVLVVEEQRFHVHRSTLAFWSPVFERMFTSDFKEKNSEEIPLPGKRASEMKKLLQIMYPSLEEKVITSDNCYFLLDLAREYQIASITRKCEDFLVSAVKTRKEKDVLAVLTVGQDYELKILIESCVYEARRLSLKELKQHTKRAEIDPDNYVQITEGIIERLEKQCKEVTSSCSQKLYDSTICLYNHARRKGNVPCIQLMHMYDRWAPKPSTDHYLQALYEDNAEHKCPSSPKSFCPGLSDVSKHLTELKQILETLP